MGKLHMTEGATAKYHPTLPPCTNPWGAPFWPGISSSGAGVAVAAGFCYGALATDTLGSIRMPAAACGVVGLKPTWGRVSRYGVFPLAETFDHVGIIARSAADVAVLLQVIAGDDSKDPTTLIDPVSDCSTQRNPERTAVRLGVDWKMTRTRIDPVVLHNFEQAVCIFESLGADVREVALPPIDTLADDLMPLLVAEAASAHADIYPSQRQRYGPWLSRVLDRASDLRAPAIAKAVQIRQQFNGALRRASADVDVLLLPAIPVQTPTLAEVDEMFETDTFGDRIQRYMVPGSASGLPTLSVPCGWDANGMPMGIQLIGKHLGEAQLCALGHVFERGLE
jgi:amidase